MLAFFTFIANLVAMAATLWLAVYLFPRGRANRITFRLIIALLALSFYYLVQLTFVPEGNRLSNNLSSFAIILSLAAIHNLSHYLLRPGLQKKHVWVTRSMLLFALIAGILSLVLPFPEGDALYVDSPPLAGPYLAVALYQILSALLILWNLRAVVQSGSLPLNRSFIIALVLGAGTMIYALAGLVIGVRLPQFFSTLLVLSSLLLIGYSISRHQALVELRVIKYDLPLSVLLASFLVGLYFVLASVLGFGAVDTAIILVAVILTHGTYGWVRELFARVLSRQEKEIADQIRKQGVAAQDEKELGDAIRRTLAVVCHSLQASGGFIAVLEEGGFVVRSSFHSLPAGESLPEWEAASEEISPPIGPLREQIAWFIPGFGGGEKLVILALAERKRLRSYSPADLDWLQDVTDHLADLAFLHRSPTIATPSSPPTSPEMPQLLNEDLRKDVEFGFRNLHDVITLGKSPLTAWLQIQGGTHIERGRRVQEMLIELLESLRPGGDRPGEPIPKEWHNYIVLHDAYLEDIPDNQIMMRLYISEGTFYRIRRKAIRAIARAVMETRKDEV